MEVPEWQAAKSEAAADRERLGAAVELRAAIALVGGRPDYRMLLCGMAIDAAMVSELDDTATAVGVVLERRIRLGGGLDVVVRSA